MNWSAAICLNDGGKPARLTLREMTVDEVLTALEWSAAESERLQAEAEPAEKLFQRMNNGEDLNISEETRARAVAALRKAGNAMVADARLVDLVGDAMPEWEQHKGMLVGEAVSRFWPGGARQ